MTAIHERLKFQLNLDHLPSYIGGARWKKRSYELITIGRMFER